MTRTMSGGWEEAPLAGEGFTIPVRENDPQIVPSGVALDPAAIVHDATLLDNDTILLTVVRALRDDGWILRSVGPGDPRSSTPLVFDGFHVFLAKPGHFEGGKPNGQIFLYANSFGDVLAFETTRTWTGR